MNFGDIFKNSFLSGFENGVDVAEVIVCLGITTILALYIFFVYRLVTRRTFYSGTFNLSVISMAILTAAIILTIQSNIVISLGMVGALSIIRFRTAIKDPFDLVFLYWAISVGIICGAGLSVIAVAVSLVMSVVIVLMQHYPAKRLSMILVVNSTVPRSDKEILEVVRKHSRSSRVKSKNLTGTTLDMIVEINVDEESDLIHEVMGVEGVVSASILSHDGEITA